MQQGIEDITVTGATTRQFMTLVDYPRTGLPTISELITPSEPVSSAAADRIACKDCRNLTKSVQQAKLWTYDNMCNFFQAVLLQSACACRDQRLGCFAVPFCSGALSEIVRLQHQHSKAYFWWGPGRVLVALVIQITLLRFLYLSARQKQGFELCNLYLAETASGTEPAETSIWKLLKLLKPKRMERVERGYFWMLPSLCRWMGMRWDAVGCSLGSWEIGGCVLTYSDGVWHQGTPTYCPHVPTYRAYQTERIAQCRLRLRRWYIFHWWGHDAQMPNGYSMQMWPTAS